MLRVDGEKTVDGAGPPEGLLSALISLALTHRETLLGAR